VTVAHLGNIARWVGGRLEWQKGVRTEWHLNFRKLLYAKMI